MENKHQICQLIVFVVAHHFEKTTSNHPLLFSSNEIPMLCLHRSSSLASWRLSEEVQKHTVLHDRSAGNRCPTRPTGVAGGGGKPCEVRGWNRFFLQTTWVPTANTWLHSPKEDGVWGFGFERYLFTFPSPCFTFTFLCGEHETDIPPPPRLYWTHWLFLGSNPSALELQAIWVRPERIGCKCLLTHPVKIHTVHLHWYCNSVNKLVIWIYGAILYTVVAFCCKETFSMIRHDSARPKNWRYREQTRHFRCIRGWYPQLRRFFLLVWGRVPTPRWLCFTYISPLRFFHL